MRIRPTQVLEAVEAALDPRNRIPLAYRAGDTFFDSWDFWDYEAGPDCCIRCGRWNGVTLPGDIVAWSFPWLEVLDAETIAPMVHPNCMCRFRRHREFAPI